MVVTAAVARVAAMAEVAWGAVMVGVEKAPEKTLKSMLPSPGHNTSR